MNAPLRAAPTFDIQGLVQAMAHNHAVDRFSCSLARPQWDLLASYMQPFALTPGQVLIQQGTVDRTVYVLESGTECKVWALSPMRFSELTNRHPAIALEVTLGLGAVLSRRMTNKPKRVAVT